MERSAVVSQCGFYRSSLVRLWDADKGRAVFVMLNPSVADALIDDPTIRRCIGFAKAWGLGGITVVNLFQLRSTNPNALLTAAIPLNPADADQVILGALDCAELAIAGWGSLPKRLEWRANEVKALAASRRLCHLGLTKNGSPRHPLYLRNDARLGALPSPEQQHGK